MQRFSCRGYAAQKSWLRGKVLRDTFLAQKNSFVQPKGLCGTESNSKYDFIQPKSPFGTFFLHSKYNCVCPKSKHIFYPPKRLRDVFPAQSAEQPFELIRSIKGQQSFFRQHGLLYNNRKHIEIHRKIRLSRFFSGFPHFLNEKQTIILQDLFLPDLAKTLVE